jgi:alpha-glucosidase (family GH31 glycosyl hydrolase)
MEKKKVSQTGSVNLQAPLDHVNVHFIGGHVIPTQTPGYTVYDSRQGEFSLNVALDQYGSAKGKKKKFFFF